MMAAMKPNMAGNLLGELLHGIADTGEFASLTVKALTLDSREVSEGALFMAVMGSREHGIVHLEQALKQGAVAVLAEPHETVTKLPETLIGQGRRIPLVQVADLRAQSGIIAGRFYGNPSAQMHVIGVTGTNGKTSVSQFVAQALEADGPCGIIGTLGSGVWGAIQSDSGRTTPDAVSLQARLAHFLDDGIRQVVMEVSSHGLEQYRVGGVKFDTAAYTNLSHEHLDYHGTMENYAAAKQRLFLQPGLRHAVLNIDDPYARSWLPTLPASVQVMTYGLADNGNKADLLADDLVLSATGLSMSVRSAVGEGHINSALLGRFNAANLLAALGVLLAGGMDFATALQRLSQVQTVAGRMEGFGGKGAALGVVDYAHTPDALEHVLKALREHCRGRLICVFGCGGDRDRLKRPLMGEIAERLADVVVVTDDNPRSEAPQGITREILAGMKNPQAITVMHEREQAIRHAAGMAGVDDVVLIAGKGHEEVQEIGGRCLPFSDRLLARQLFVQGGAHG